MAEMPVKPKPAPETPVDPSAPAVPLSPPPEPKTLTPEEQMALFEKDLKENDWGHQPC